MSALICQELSSFNQCQTFKINHILNAISEAMQQLKAVKILPNDFDKNSQLKYSYYLTIFDKFTDTISFLIKFFEGSQTFIKYEILVIEHSKQKIPKGDSLIKDYFNNLNTNEHFKICLNSLGRIKCQNAINLQNSRKPLPILCETIKKEILYSLNKILEQIKGQKQEKILKQCKRDLLQLREAFEQNRKSRLRASSIGLKLKQIKIVSEVMDLLFLNKTKLSQIKQIKSNVKSGLKLYEKFQKKSKEKNLKLFNISNNNILKCILIKEKICQKKLRASELSQIYQGIYRFKHQLTLFTYNQKDSQKNINDQIQNNMSHQSSKNQQQQIYTKQLIEKRATDIFLDVFRNQMTFLIYVRNLSCPYIAQYYSQKQKKSFQNNRFYLQKYEEDLEDLSKKLDYKSKVKITLKLAIFLQFLKCQKICHRDLKPCNIMIDRNLNPRVIDWGSCCGFFSPLKEKANFKAYKEQLMSTKGYYQSYSQIERARFKQAQKYSKQQVEKSQFFDIYSFGKILDDVFQLKEQKNQQQHFIDDIKYLRSKCLQINPEDRLSALQIQIYLSALKKGIDLLYNQMVEDESSTEDLLSKDSLSLMKNEDQKSQNNSDTSHRIFAKNNLVFNDLQYLQ